MGFLDGLFKSPSEKGKEDGTKQDKDFIRHALDEDYRKGYDRGKGLRDGSENMKHPFAGPIIEVGQKMGKSEEYKRGYDRGKATYGTTGDIPPKLFGFKEKSDRGGGYSSGHAGRSSNGFSGPISSIFGCYFLMCILAGVVSVIVCFLFLGIPALIEKHQGITDQETGGAQQVIPQEAKELPFTIGLLPGSYLFTEPSSSADPVAIVKGLVPIGVYNIQGDWFMVKWKNRSTNGEEKIGWFHRSEPYYYLSEGPPTLKQVGAKWSLIILLKGEEELIK